MTVSVNIHEAKTHLSSLLERVMNGEEVIIAKAGKPIVVLSALYHACFSTFARGLVCGVNYTLWVQERQACAMGCFLTAAIERTKDNGCLATGPARAAATVRNGE